ncbi:MAG: hypothetical protein ACPGTU_06855 [Myxococcota bacterium]
MLFKHCLVGLIVFFPWFTSAFAGAIDCPPGMVGVGGVGTLGMTGQPYGIVETKHLARVDAPEKDCPAVIGRTPGATACWVQTDMSDPVLKPRQVEVQPFCIEARPFPGTKYSTDGLTVWGAHRLDALLRAGSFGQRRLCTATEFQAAVAGLKGNQRFVFGDKYVAGRCEAADKRTVGGDPECRNDETGVVDYGAVHSHWVVADQSFVDRACDKPPCRGAGSRPLQVGAYVVMGGTNRVQTRQAPYTPHTWHDHGEATPDACGFDGWDDQAAICADPGAGDATTNASYAAFKEQVRKSGSINAALSDALGEEVCLPSK